jgi:hypothetical protein
MGPARSRMAFFSAAIAALAAVLAVVLPSGIASAALGPAAENRVWAFPPRPTLTSGLTALFPQVSV